MAVFSSKTKPCYDNDPNLKVKKELGKLEVELKEVVARRYWFMYLLGNLDNRSPQCQLNQSNGFTCEIVSKCKPS